jgi:hypothetical protein
MPGWLLCGFVFPLKFCLEFRPLAALLVYPAKNFVRFYSRVGL